MQHFDSFLFSRNILANARIGDPVAGSGKHPEDAAMSRWLYFSGFFSPDPCLSNPEASIKNAAGPVINSEICIH